MIVNPAGDNQGEGDEETEGYPNTDKSPVSDGKFMKRSDVEEVVYRMTRKVKPSLRKAALTQETRFDDYEISSLELAMITFEIEDHFDLNIANANLDTFVNIREACDLVIRLLTNKGYVVRHA